MRPSSKPLRKEFLANFLITKPKIVTLDYRLQREQQLEKGCIIDIETTGLDPQLHHIITFGILRRKTARVYQLTNPDYVSFKALVTQKTQRSQKPRYAYNARFESDFTGIQEGWHDLTQYEERHDEWIWYDGPYYRMHLDQCTLTPFQEPDITGSQVPQHWQQWLNKHKPQTLWAIAQHNLSDLLRTRQLIKT
jgi:uncharacterized protein YprB with RNaseH-like and TPR domain